MGSVGPATAIKPRLLIILNRFVIGGQAVDTIPLAHDLQKWFEVLILYGEKEKDEIEPAFLLERYPGLNMKKVSSLRRSINPFTDISSLVSLYNIINTFKPHIVHTHGAKSGVLGRLASWVSGVPVVVHTFHGHFFHSYFSGWVSRLVASVERMIGRITTAAIALSETQKHELSAVYRILPEEKITVVSLGFAATSQDYELAHRSTFRNRYGLNDNDVAIGIVGRIVSVKNHSFFVQVVKEFQYQHLQSNAAFFVIGDGELRKHVEEELSANALPFSTNKISAENRILFTSWLQDMDEVMSGLDITVLTSLNEGTPVSMLESQFFRRPVVCTNVGGVKDTMVDGKTGFLVPPGNVADFVQKLALLVHDPKLREQMGEAGRRFVQAKFSKENEVNTTTDFYLSLLRKKNKHFTTSQLN